MGAKGKAQHLLGICLLLVVVVMWVGSSFLIQTIYKDFDSPFFLTYFNTSLFTSFLVGKGLIHLWELHFRRTSEQEPLIRPSDNASDHRRNNNNAAHLDGSRSASPTVHGKAVLAAEDRLAPVEPVSLSPAWDRRRGDSPDSVAVIDMNGKAVPSGRMSLMQVARIAIVLCPLWFGLNYFYNTSLLLTSLASNTILSATSSLWTLVLTRVVLKQPVHLLNALGVAFTISGSVFVALFDTQSSDHPNTFWGDLWCLVSAVLYATYTIMLEVKVPNEDEFDMYLLFGLIGLFNTVLAWPGLILLDWADIEDFDLPSNSSWGFLFLNGCLGTVVSDFLWAKAVLLTSPLIATLGLTLTIPLAMVVDFIINGNGYSFLYVVGSLFVVCGFVLVNCNFKRELDEDEEEHAGGAGRKNSDEAAIDAILSNEYQNGHSGSNGVKGRRHHHRIEQFEDVDDDDDDDELSSANGSSRYSSNGYHDGDAADHLHDDIGVSVE